MLAGTAVGGQSWGMQVRRGIRDYPFVGVVLLTAVVGVVLEIAGPPGSARWVVGAVALVIAALQLRGMVEALRAGSYGVDVLAVTAIVSTVAVGEYWAALVVGLMLTGGEALEDARTRRGFAGPQYCQWIDRLARDVRWIAAGVLRGARNFLARIAHHFQRCVPGEVAVAFGAAVPEGLGPERGQDDRNRVFEVDETFIAVQELYQVRFSFAFVHAGVTLEQGLDQPDLPLHTD